MEEEAVPRAWDLAIGQVAEWLVWTRLTATSDGDLHVFLPLDDRGVDGIVHRISTGMYAPVQVKGRTLASRREMRLLVLEHELEDDRAFIVAVSLRVSAAALGPAAFVAPVPEFRRLAHRYVFANGSVGYQVVTRIPPPAGSVWTAFCLPTDAVGERLLPTASAGAEVAEKAGPEVADPELHDFDAAKRLGSRAEMELLRRMADCEVLNAFKAFPDLEPNEYLAYNTQTRDILGIQVKAVAFAPGRREATMNVYLPALHPSPSTWFVIFLAEAGTTAFLPDCAVIPSTVVAQHLFGAGPHARMSLTRQLTGRVAKWRVPLASLGERLAAFRAPHAGLGDRAVRDRLRR